MQKMIIKRITAITFIFYIAILPVFSITLNDAQLSYLEGEYWEAIDKTKQLKIDDSVLYFLGMSNMKKGKYAEARGYFTKLLKNFSNSPLYELALFRFADTYFVEGNLKKAAEFYKDIEKKYPNFNYLPLLYLRLAQISNKEGEWEDKRKYLEILKRKFPQSIEIRYVKDIENEDSITVQVGAFSSKKNALSMIEELKNDNYSAYIVEDKNGIDMLYKVRVGKFAKRGEAEKISLRLLEDGYPAKIYP